MGWDTRFLSMVAVKRCIALLVLAMLVLGGLAKPAIPDLADRTSPASAIFLSEEDLRADPVTLPAALPSALNKTVAAVLARALGEPARGLPPIKSSMPLLAAAGLSIAPVTPRLVRPRVDRPSSLHVCAVGSARTPTGPPLQIA